MGVRQTASAGCLCAGNWKRFATYRSRAQIVNRIPLPHPSRLPGFAVNSFPPVRPQSQRNLLARRAPVTTNVCSLRDLHRTLETPSTKCTGMACKVVQQSPSIKGLKIKRIEI